MNLFFYLSCFLFCRGCSLAAKGNEMDTELCIAASVSESSRNRVKWDILRDVVIPFLLGTVIKGWFHLNRPRFS